jgi:hypothetical protein
MKGIYLNVRPLRGRSILYLFLTPGCVPYPGLFKVASPLEIIIGGRVFNKTLQLTLLRCAP